MALLVTISTPTRTLADIISDAMAVAMILASLGWTSADADALAGQHPDLPAIIIDATIEALAEAEATRGPPNA